MNTITYLKLDADGDPIMNPAAAYTDKDAVKQAILTRLLLFMGEWWEDLNEGTPWFQIVLGTPATPNNQQVWAQALAARITGAPYVTAIQNLTFSFTNRAFKLNASVQTQFGTVDISFSPGALAGSQG
jgi:hypothetical protein